MDEEKREEKQSVKKRLLKKEKISEKTSEKEKPQSASDKGSIIERSKAFHRKNKEKKDSRDQEKSKEYKQKKGEEEKEIKIVVKQKSSLVRGLVAAGVLLLAGAVAAGGFFFSRKHSKGGEEKMEILTTASLENIVKVSELYTYQSVYNGVAEVWDEANASQLDYYVAYESKIKAGINLEEIEIELDEETKTVTITLPKVDVRDVDVDIASLEYMFEDKKANTNTVSEQAYKACIADASKESGDDQAIYECARENAKNIVKALVEPFLEEADGEYKLEVL